MQSSKQKDKKLWENALHHFSSALLCCSRARRELTMIMFYFRIVASSMHTLFWPFDFQKKMVLYDAIPQTYLTNYVHCNCIFVDVVVDEAMEIEATETEAMETEPKNISSSIKIPRRKGNKDL